MCSLVNLFRSFFVPLQGLGVMFSTRPSVRPSVRRLDVRLFSVNCQRDRLKTN